MLEKYNKNGVNYKYRGLHCLNCNLPLDKTDKYCPNCGQENSTRKLNLTDLITEFFSGMFSYDSRFQRTLRIMLFKPGQISKDYINGKRIRYANPFRFYLSASIIFFLISGFADQFEDVNLAARDENFQKNIAEIQKDSLVRAKIEEIDILKERNIPLDSITGNISGDKKETETYKDSYIPQKKLDSLDLFTKNGRKLEIFYKYYKETRINNPKEALQQLEYENTGWNTWLYQKAMRFDLFYNNPKIFADYFISKLPFIIFFYLPVFALFIWLIYLRRPFNYMEHLIFAFHVQTTLFVLYIIGYSIDYILKSDWGFTLANSIFVFYLYKSMRNFYGQGRVKTILKFITLNIIFFILAAIAIITAVIVSFSIF